MRRTVLVALTVLALSVGVCAASAVSVERAVRGAEGLLQQSVQAAWATKPVRDRRRRRCTQCGWSGSACWSC